MRSNRTFPRAGDRVRLAVPGADGTPRVRYGTVLERSCGRSHALKVRWDDAGRGSTEGWLADAAWYWDRSQLRVVDRREAAAPDATPAAAGADSDAWLAHRAAPAGGSIDAVAEWEAALSAELDAVTAGAWDPVLAGAPARPVPAAAPAPVPAVAVAPKAPPAPAAAPAPSRPGGDILPGRPAPKAAPAKPAAAKPAAAKPVAAAPAAPPAPAPAPAPWTGGDILPRKPAKKGRRGR